MIFNIFPDRGVASSVRMTQFLPPNLLALFAPRDPIPFLPPVDKLPHEKKATHNYSGIAQYVHLFEDPVSTKSQDIFLHSFKWVLRIGL